MASNIYRNRMIINQRGGSITIDNTTEQEKVNISQRSGSNITIANHVTSELATNNKQLNVVNDSFKTVWGNDSEFVGKKKIIRTCEDTVQLKGVLEEEQLAAYDQWKKTYGQIANLNAQSKITRQATAYPGGIVTIEQGTRAPHPTVGSTVYTVNNDQKGNELQTGLRSSFVDTVTEYKGMQTHFPAAKDTTITKDMLVRATTQSGVASLATSVNFDQSPSSENGNYSLNPSVANIHEKIAEIQPTLTQLEQLMGTGGDEINFTKRNMYSQIGATFNDYPSLRILEKGKIIGKEVLVTPGGATKVDDAVSNSEIIDNSTTYNCGNDDATICNRMSRNVGSGGISMKTTGPMELGGSQLTVGFKCLNLNASNGIQIASEDYVELKSVNSVALRSNSQVYVEPSLGVKGNATIGGGVYIEGELFCQHLTAPAEIHQTQDTQVLGQFACAEPRSLIIAEALICGQYFPVYALPRPNLITTYPHSHHHVGPAMRLMESNEGVRLASIQGGINLPTSIAQALPQVNERKTPGGFGYGVQFEVPLCFGGFVDVELCGVPLVHAEGEIGMDVNFDLGAGVTGVANAAGNVTICGIPLAQLYGFLGIDFGVGISFVGCGEEVGRIPGKNPIYVVDITDPPCEGGGTTSFQAIPLTFESEESEDTQTIETETVDPETGEVSITREFVSSFKLVRVVNPSEPEPEFTESEVEPETDEFTESGDTIL